MMRTPALLFCVFTAGEGSAPGLEAILFLDSVSLPKSVCSFRGLVKLWSALTLLGHYRNQACAFRVLQVSYFYFKFHFPPYLQYQLLGY